MLSHAKGRVRMAKTEAGIQCGRRLGRPPGTPESVRRNDHIRFHDDENDVLSAARSE